MAFAFAGQGAQHRNMGANLFPRFRDLVRTADSILGYSVAEVIAADDQRLGRTEYTQPLIYVVNALAFLDFRARTGLVADYLLGHSVGELSALYAAEAFDFETGLRIVKRRGELMAACPEGAMAALVGPKPMLVALVDETEGLYLANNNSPTQVTVAGTRIALRTLEDKVGRAAAVTLIPLPVSGAFHSPLMAGARDEFAECLASHALSEPRTPVVANVSARPHRLEELRRNLVEHLTAPVRWLDSLNYLLGVGPMLFQDIGPGRIVSSLIRDTIARAAAPARAQS